MTTRVICPQELVLHQRNRTLMQSACKADDRPAAGALERNEGVGPSLLGLEGPRVASTSRVLAVRCELESQHLATSVRLANGDSP
jgi:hypothetical protein